MTDNNSNNSNKTIAKNAFMLYIRMFVSMLVTLYTTRVMLQILGIENYGIYNIVGGVVVLFSFINTAMVSATQRFITFELGKKNFEKLRRVFSMCLQIHIIIAIILVILSETIGLWLFFNNLDIPQGRHTAAAFVYQFSIAIVVLEVIKVPYNAAIIAYEKMNFYAYVSILDVFVKLLLLYLLYIISGDKLIIYSGLLVCWGIVHLLIYIYYNIRSFSSSRLLRYWDTVIFKEIFGYSVWTLFGQMATVLSTQGLNILFNMFHGVVVNAAMGIANQVSGAVYLFVNNFQTAFKPQIIKRYANDDFDNLFNLNFIASKISFFLLLLVSLPVMFNMNYVLSIWLKDFPPYAPAFCIYIIIFLYIDALAGPQWMTIAATGRIRAYQIVTAIVNVSNLPISYLILKLGYNPVYCLINKILLNLLMTIIRLFLLKNYIKFPVFEYMSKVFFPCWITCIITLPFLFIYNKYVSLPELANFILKSLFAIILTVILFYTIALRNNEKKLVNLYMLKIRTKVFKS